MESYDRPLYEYYSDMADKAASGKELSETETIILEIYIKNYLLVRLLNKFLIFAVSPLVKFIDFSSLEKFECSIAMARWFPACIIIFLCSSRRCQRTRVTLVFF